MVSISLKIFSALTRFVFPCQTAYDCVSTVKKAFINTSSATLQSLAMDAPSIGLEKLLVITRYMYDAILMAGCTLFFWLITL